MDYISKININIIWHVNKQWVTVNMDIELSCDDTVIPLKEQNLWLPNIKYLCDINCTCDVHKFDFIFYSLSRHCESYNKYGKLISNAITILNRPNIMQGALVNPPINELFQAIMLTC